MAAQKSLVAVAAGIGCDAEVGIEDLVLTGNAASATAGKFVEMVFEGSKESQVLDFEIEARAADAVDTSGSDDSETVHVGLEVPMDCDLVDQKILFQLGHPE